MLQKLKEFWYVWSGVVVSVALAILLVAGTVFFTKSYADLLEKNNRLLTVIESERETNDALVGMWQERYNKVLEQYSDLLAVNSKMRYTLENIELLSECVQCEAGENNLESQRNITSVILNRLKSEDFADTLSGVIYEKVEGCPQFSTAWDDAMDSVKVSPVVRANVYSVLCYGSELPDYVKYFYSSSLEEDNWVKDLEIYDEVEGTIFSYCKEDFSYE